MAEIKSVRAMSLLCPSAQPEMADSRVLGVVGGEPGALEIAYLNETLPVTQGLLSLTAPFKPTEVFRFSATCEGTACCHFDGSQCRLVTRIVQLLPAVTEVLPACLIRPACRWHKQEGKAACLRCPQIVTQTYEPNEEMRRAALG
jgi:hypothetical protein